ncbi:MAG: SRPBCC family protein [Pseudomonadota bacterium]
MLLCLFAPCANADVGADKSIEVSVRIEEHEVIVDMQGYVRATPREAWSVMTDYDGAPSFISKLEKSVTLLRTEEMLVVSQKGTMGFGPFSVPIETVSEIRLTPFEKMQSHLLSGNMKKSEAITRLIPDGAGTRIVYHLESIPDAWIPPLIGRALVEFETRGRFNELFDEILRRKSSADARR